MWIFFAVLKPISLSIIQNKHFKTRCRHIMTPLSQEPKEHDVPRKYGSLNLQNIDCNE